MNAAKFYSGLFLLTAATLMLEILQVRLLSVVTWYHLAFFVISTAMFGMTGGAVWVYLRSERFTSGTLSADLTRFTAAFAICAGLSLFFQVTLAPIMSFSVSMLIVFTELALAMSAPFFFSGVAVTLALTRSPFPVSRVYAVDLAGAALGCLGILGLLDLTDAPSAILLTGALAAGAAALFGGGGAAVGPARRPRAPRLLARPGLLCGVLALLGGANAVTKHGVQPLLVKDEVEKRLGSTIYERWNSFSRVVADAPMHGTPILWGPSPVLPAMAVDQIRLRIDGMAGTMMFRFGGNTSDASYLTYDVTNLAYSLRHAGRAAVVGVGSGRDLLSAWEFGFRDLTGVEINPIFIDLLTRDPFFSSFAGLHSLPGIRLVVDEARSWFARTRERFDVIQMSMIDTWASTGAGAFTLTENGLYTVDGWRIFLGRLTPGGLFTVSRWYSPGEVNETGKMVSLAMATLMDSGVKEPRNHIFVASSGQVATLVLSAAPLSVEDLATLRRVCNERRYRVLLSPDRDETPSETLRGIYSASDRRALDRLTARLDLDLTPTTDERPFFFNLVPLSRPGVAFRYAGRNSGVITGNLVATAVLCALVLVSAVLVVTTILLPLRPAIRQVGSRLALGGTAYFMLLGLGFMFVEMGLLQRLSVFLGHPVYSLSIVLFSLILSTGFGSFLSDRWRIDRGHRIFAWAALLSAHLLALPLWMPAAMRAFQASDILVRAALSLAMIAPSGLMMGFGFPTGMRLAQVVDPRPTPWFWGVNGASGVMASAIAVAVSIAFGINVTFYLGGLCYLGLIPAAFLFASGSRQTLAA